MTAITAQTAPVDRLIGRLDGARRNGTQWMARCPAHPDREPSLSISEGDDGRALVYCHAGCDLDAVLRAVGLDASDLFAEPRTRSRSGFDILSTYPYCDEDGEVLFEVVRLTSPKSFRQRRPDGRGGWTWSTRGVRRVLYRLPEVIAAVAAGERLYVCEGEKDADALARAGFVATTNPGGAGKWSAVVDAPEILAGAQVVIVADRDGPGYDHARDVARSLMGRASEVTVVEAASGKDAADHLAAGLSVDELVVVAGTGLEDCPLDAWLYELDDDASPDEGDGDPLTSLDPIDLGPALNGEREIIEATILVRDDGRGLLYAGQINGLHAKDGIGKSWVALFAAVEQLRAGKRVLWIDCEDPNETTIVGRLTALGATAGAIRDRFRYVNPSVELTRRGAVERIVSHVDAETTLVVVDSIGEAFSLDGVNEDRDDEVGPWYRQVLRPIAEAGPAVVTIDHATNANDDPLRPSGSKRKRAAVTGQQLEVKAPTPFSKDQGGKLRLTCAKDRHGNYRRGDVVADIVVHVDEGGIGFEVYAPTASKGDAPLEVELAASAVFNVLADAGGGPVSQRELLELVRPKLKASTDTKRAGIERAVRQGRIIETEGPRGARHFTTAPDRA